MLNIIMAAAFQYVEVADKVGVRVRMGVFQGVTNTRLRGQMNHTIKLLSSEKRSHAFTVC